MLEKQLKRYKRHRRIRAKISGTSKIPRLCVFRSAKHIYAQLIDDEKGNTILSLSDLKFKKAEIRSLKKEQKQLSRKVNIAYNIGVLLAKKASENKINKVVFDRGGYEYHGRVKAVSDGARDGGLEF